MSEYALAASESAIATGPRITGFRSAASSDQAVVREPLSTGVAAAEYNARNATEGVPYRSEMAGPVLAPPAATSVAPAQTGPAAPPAVTYNDLTAPLPEQAQPAAPVPEMAPSMAAAQAVQPSLREPLYPLEPPANDAAAPPPAEPTQNAAGPNYASGPVLDPVQSPAEPQPPAAPLYEQAPAIEPRPAVQPASYRAAMQPVCDRAAAITARAMEKAQRGLLYAAKADLTQALQLLAQARDIQDNSTVHMTALATGLTALKEANDFTPKPGREGELIDVTDISRTHRTTLLKESGPMSPILAQQQYYNLACHQLSLATHGEPVGSHALYALGRIQSALAVQSADPQALHLPQALVYHQAALSVDRGNYMAANELGVLLAKYGQLAAARQALVHSVTVHPHVEGWHNLATIHERLGERDLARLATSERDLLAKQQPKPATTPAGIVEWVDAKTFAASGGKDTAWPAEAPQTAAKPTTTTRK